MRKLFKNLTKRDKIIIFIIALIIIFQVGVELRLPDFMSEITKLIQQDGSKMSEILEQGGYMLACAFASMASLL